MEITVNGQRYDSWDAVPDDVKRLVAGQIPDADGNGVPDLLEGKGPGVVSSTVTTSTSFVVDGQTYDSIEALPPDIRKRLEALLPASATNPAPSTATTPPPLSAGQPLSEGEVLLNGVPTRVHSDPPQKKRWWQRGS